MSQSIMHKTWLIAGLIFTLCSCKQGSESIVGTYQLEVSDMKKVDGGELEIVGEPGDYFGKLTLSGKKLRVYEVGLQYKSKDSLSFFLPGKGGFLVLKKNGQAWLGQFKYFGLQGNIKARKTGPPSGELLSLAALKPLAPGIISTTGEESFPSFDEDNGILYFCRGKDIYSSQSSASGWSEPSLLPISREFNDAAPFIFNQGKSLLFTSNRPLDGKPGKKNLWISEKSEGAWGNPVPLPSPVNVDTLGDYHGSMHRRERLYFVSYKRPDGFGRSDIYSAVLTERGDFEVENLGTNINTDKSEADVYADPEGRFLLLASTGRSDGFGADDIYISKREGGTWGKPVNLGPKVNSYAYEYGAWVDFRHGYLYFNSYRRGSSDIYRVALQEIEEFSDILA